MSENNKLKPASYYKEILNQAILMDKIKEWEKYEPKLARRIEEAASKGINRVYVENSEVYKLMEDKIEELGFTINIDPDDGTYIITF